MCRPHQKHHGFLTHLILIERFVLVSPKPVLLSHFPPTPHPTVCEAEHLFLWGRMSRAQRV